MRSHTYHLLLVYSKTLSNEMSEYHKIIIQCIYSHHILYVHHICASVMHAEVKPVFCKHQQH